MRQIVRQPDGRLAVYSTVVDDLVMYDATPDEVADEAADFVRETASPPCHTRTGRRTHQARSRDRPPQRRIRPGR
ncbi:hypothetical protein ACFU8W_24225 [Streptomyces sp. NPDC057565]|uniref:hypothetical protein n=1 Tax=Streptomyces sp. NPDC057565 TaxID=3346169 RepID=UPI0036ABC024